LAKICGKPFSSAGHGKMWSAVMPAVFARVKSEARGCGVAVVAVAQR